MGVSRIYEASGFQFDTYEGLIKEADERALAYLGGLEKDLYDSGVMSVTKRVVRGQADNTIVDLTRQMPGNLVVMTTHGCSGICRWILGSVADGEQKPVGAGIGSDTR